MTPAQNDPGPPPVHPAVMAFLATLLLVVCAGSGVSVLIDIARNHFSAAHLPAGDWAMGRIILAVGSVPAWAIFRDLGLARNMSNPFKRK